MLFFQKKKRQKPGILEASYIISVTWLSKPSMDHRVLSLKFGGGK